MLHITIQFNYNNKIFNNCNTYESEAATHNLLPNETQIKLVLSNLH